MSDNSAVVVIPTNAAIGQVVGVGRQALYSSLVGLTYAALGASTYGQLQLQGATNSEVVVIPTNTAAASLGVARQLATYGNVAAAYTTYSGMNGLTYGQLGVLP